MKRLLCLLLGHRDSFPAVSLRYDTVPVSATGTYRCQRCGREETRAVAVERVDEVLVSRP